MDCGHLYPQLITVRGAVADKVGDDLAGLAAEGGSHRTRIKLGADEAPKFVECKHVAFLGGQKGGAQRRQAFGFFCSQREIV